MDGLIDTSAEGAPESGLGAALLEAGALTQGDLARANKLAAEAGERPATMMARLGLVSERALARAFAKANSLRLLTEADLPRAPIAGPDFPPRFLREMRLLPIGGDEGGWVVAMADPTDNYALAAFRIAAGAPSEIVVAEAGVIEAAVDRLYGVAAESEAGAAMDAGPVEAEVERLRDQASEAPVIRRVAAIIAAAVDLNASDIHIEPGEREWRLRYRIDGQLALRETIPAHLAPALVSRVKILGRLDIAERRRPQDGRIRTAVRGRTIDLRVSIIPLLHGESVVIRVLDRDGVSLDFAALGIPEDARDGIARVLERPQGVFLVTGPTGSGKTTTLYAALRAVNKPESKILSVEDPVEYQIEGVGQVQTHAAIGLGFAAVLRSLLRHDPDVMMVGEIRDGETAQIATQAALTGHLVISTLHTNDAPSAVTRLMDMGVEPFLIASTLSAVGAQRLVRRLCPDCRAPMPAPSPVIAEFGLPMDRDGGPPTLWRPVGCDTCRGRGYRGRLAIFELMAVTPAIRELILTRPGAAELRRAAEAEGMRGMLQDGVAKALAGVTTLEEALRAARAG